MSRRAGDWISSYLRFTDNTEPTELYREWVAVSVVAAALQRKTYLEWGITNVYPNMYIVLVGPPGVARKGTAMDPGQMFLDELGIPLSAEATTREALIRDLKRVAATTTTPEGKVIMHSSLTVYSQELTVFLGYNNQQLMADLCDWYDCRRKWRYKTKTQGEDFITNVWVNLIGATTPDLMRTALPQDAQGGGLTSRMIFVYAERKGKSVPIPFLTPELRQLREDLALDLEDINMMIGRFEPTKEWYDTYIEWYMKEEIDPAIRDPRFIAYQSRRSTHLRKLCMIMSASRSSDFIITEDDFHRALSLLERTEKVMPRAFSGFGMSDDAAITSNIMVFIANNKEVTFDQVFRRFLYDASERKIADILSTLHKIGFCRVDLANKKVTYIEGGEELI